MERIRFEHLDIPIIRSCNLACKGCITHSDHKNIKGTVKVEDSRELIKFWASKLNPVGVTLFGGEPLLHPEFADWATLLRQEFGWETMIKVNTNGYYIDRLYDRIPDVFDARLAFKNKRNAGISMIVSVQTGTEPYLSKVYENIETLKQKIVDFHRGQNRIHTAEWEMWLDEYETNYKRWYRLVVNGHNTGINIAVCDQYKLSWCTHYQGFGSEMTPCYDYNDQWYEENHPKCQARDFVTLHNGKLWKCPPIGVLEHSLKTFGIADRADWAPYLQNYQTVNTASTDAEIAEWFEQQKLPEKVCNMCAFAGPKNVKITAEERSHYLKNHWKYTL